MHRRTVGLALLAGFLTACRPSGTSEGPLPPARSPQELIEPPPPPQKVEGVVYWGTVKKIANGNLVMELRDGKELNVDISDAQKRGRAVVPTVNANLVINGTIADGVVKARLVSRAKGRTSWGADVTE